jgi:hypothetical protein
MIVSLRGKRARAFFKGVWVKAFHGCERKAGRKLIVSS